VVSDEEGPCFLRFEDDIDRDRWSNSGFGSESGVQRGDEKKVWTGVRRMGKNVTTQGKGATLAMIDESRGRDLPALREQHSWHIQKFLLLLPIEEQRCQQNGGKSRHTTSFLWKFCFLAA